MVSPTRALIAFVSILLLAPLLTWGQASKATPTPKPSPTPRATATAAGKPSAKGTPRVFTNDDLEADKDKSKVQDLRATGGEPYEPPEPLADVPKPLEEPTPEPDPKLARVTELEREIQTLDASAKAILWQYLQSNDSNEIMRLKAEQQEMLNRIEEAKAELAQLKGEAASGTPRLPTPTPTPPPG